MLRFALFTLFILLPPVVIHAATNYQPSAASQELVRQGNEAFRKDRAAAISLFTQAIAADPSNHIAYYNRGRIHDVQGRVEPALADYNRLLEMKPDHVETLQWRGGLLLRLGRFAEALADFEGHIKLIPAHKGHHWMRGIALYYTGKHDEARDQFDSCHRADTNDVEHTLWHFLSVARNAGLEKARASMLLPGTDWRKSLEKIHSFYAGKATAEEVIAAANAGNPAIDELSKRLVFAHFYLGAYYEVAGDATRATDHFTKAAAVATKDDVLGAVARARLREGENKSARHQNDAGTK